MLVDDDAQARRTAYAEVWVEEEGGFVIAELAICLVVLTCLLSVVAESLTLAVAPHKHTRNGHQNAAGQWLVEGHEGSTRVIVWR